MSDNTFGSWMFPHQVSKIVQCEFVLLQQKMNLS